MDLPRRRALSPTASKILHRPTALVLITNFIIILALILAILFTSKLLLDFHDLFHHNWVLKPLLFALLTERKKKNQSTSFGEELSYSETRRYRSLLFFLNHSTQGYTLEIILFKNLHTFYFLE